MGVATPPPLPYFCRKLFCWRQIPMSQGFHQGSIFSFSDEFDRKRRRDKLRMQGFDVSAAGHPLAPPMQDEAEEEAAMYGPSGTNNMLSDMFNFAGPADLLAGQSSNIIPPPAPTHHRLIQQRRPDFYSVGNRPQGMVMSSSAAANNWNSSVVVAAAGLSSTPHHHPHSQSFLGASFGEAAISFGVMESQAGPFLSLSNSSLQQRVRSSQEGSGSAFFYNSQQQEQQQQQLHHHAPPSFHSQGQQHESHQSQHMISYSPVGSTNLLRNSKYARAAQDLLEEFCSVGRGHVRGNTSGRNSSNLNPSHGGGAATSSAAAPASSSSSKDITVPLSPADRFENQRKKSKLLSMLDEVERRYNHYCEQMQMVVYSFDSVMGFGAATPYTALAQKAMSKHFRCLKDAITAQLKQTCELLGDKDGVSGSGLTKGETPKLRLIDQSLRQQRAFHQLGMMEQEAWRPQRGLPDRSVTILRAWLFDHFLHPYPSDADKHLLARQTGLSRNQVSNWFINARVRLWKPMVEDMYQQEANEEDDPKHNIGDETNSQRTILAAATTQQSISAALDHIHSPPDSDAPESMSIPRPQVLDHYDQLRLAAPIDTQTQPPDHHTAADVIFPPGFDDEMYRRAAAVLGGSTAGQARFGASSAAAAARTGDLSLTLGLRHAGGNAPPDAGRFGF